MAPVFVVMLIAICAPDLVHCAPLEPSNRIWETVEDCRRDKPAIIREVLHRTTRDKVVMSKCRLFLDEENRRSQLLLPKDGDAGAMLLY